MHHRQKQKRPPPVSERPAAGEWSTPRAAYMQAYESRLVYGQSEFAEKLGSKSGGYLMRWQGQDEHNEEVWADRYDMLHLLDTLPTSNRSTRTRTPSPTPSSSSSWADLPSDIEETFYLSDPEELAKRQRRKRQQWVEGLREARLAEREKEDRQADEKGKGKAAAWPENEIPNPAIQTLMTHTAASLVSSPNPQVLESRILLNHSKDERFDFLRGRWKATWDRTMKDARAKRALLNRPRHDTKAVSGLIGGYASSDDESPESETGSPPPPPEDAAPPTPEGDVDPAPLPPRASQAIERSVAESPPPVPDDDIAERQRLRRLKAEEWKRQRAANGS